MKHEDTKHQNEADSLWTMRDSLPRKLHVFPVDQAAFYPGMAAPVRANDELRQVALEQAYAENGNHIAFLAARGEGKPSEDNLHSVGVVARIERFGRLPDGAVQAYVQVLGRIEVDEWHTGYPATVSVSYPRETDSNPLKTRALFEKTRETFEELIKLLPGGNLPEFVKKPLSGLEDASKLADFVAASLNLKPEERQEVLEVMDLTERLELVLLHVAGDLEVKKLGIRIQSEIKEKQEKRQREYFLREQMGAIKRELGEEKDEKSVAEDKYEERIASVGLSEDAEEKARKELERLKLLTPESAEYNVIRTYLDVLLDLPWSDVTKDQLNMKRARKILDDDHFGLDKVKERITEFLAVQKLTSHRENRKGPILCLAGPPGVGKTSLGKSIARTLGREFYRFSLGGMRDEAEIKGHRRTYIGAMPGKILQAMTRAGTKNPVIMLDEIDKLGQDWRGDPSSAMLEVLDPEQNNSFLDHYIDVPFDLSQVFFICTANVKEHIPRPLLDRMEVVDIPGYIDHEKVEIARRHLLAKQRHENGLSSKEISVSKAALGKMIREYTMEAGVRNLERTIAAVCRKVAAGVASGEKRTVRVSERNLQKYLGPARFKKDRAARIEKPGVALGLAWTPVGGDTLLIESTRMDGSGKLKLTGKLGEVMSESAHLAMSYIKANADRFELDLDKLKEEDIHIHFPAGAIPKDGPSAGITITTALVSLLSGRCVNPTVAMTGEITLTGKVLPVGGIREKVLSAHRHGLKKVILPADNLQDLDEVPPAVRKEMEFHPVEYFEQVADLGFARAEEEERQLSAVN